MSVVNKLTRALRWLRWSTICAILFYVFFIGLILHSTTYKLQHTLKSGRQHNQQEHQHAHSHEHEFEHKVNEKLEREREHELKESSAAAAKAQLHAQYALFAAPLHQGSISSGSTFGKALLAGSSLSSATRTNVLHAPVSGAADTSFPAKTLPGMENKKRSGPAKTAVTGTGNRITGKQRKHQQQQQQHQGKHAVEPETVIIAASSVNEKQILEKALRRADKNHDNKLSIQEMAFYINKKIVDHIDEAIEINPREFRRVDISPADGVITWEEYHRFFLKSHGMTDNDIDEHNEIKHTALNRKAREDMMRDKARWSEAARTDLFSLTIDEYLSFRHPESSVSNLLELVDDLLRQFDQDGDDQLTIEEFSEVNMDDDDDLMRKSLISKTVEERRAEFRRIIDQNRDGKADRGELLHYVNPKTPRYALQEAATLFSLCDENRDGKLTLDEMVANAEVILTSKMIDTANSFHTEF